VYGSLTVYRWRELVISISGRNQWPTVSGVLDPEKLRGLSEKHPRKRDFWNYFQIENPTYLVHDTVD
jgi:hypothetical protein